ncbi:MULTISPECIES: GNAT family N-acetyltransferase [unclassified Aerococcus]|uniref:GNAT family N-acetyltransferase n=1 Tax=unclassified Aerococcus TaxID=2618060 RepID=UPI0025BC14C8|nr:MULTISPECIES: GNAT family N-acetyltransferase [unclassified Aerococcus]
MAVVIDAKVIGNLFVTYTDMQETVEIGYTFSKGFRGEGYAKEAVYVLIATVLDQSNIHRIVARIWMLEK